MILTCLRGAGGSTLRTVQEVLPEQVFSLRFMSGALRVLCPQAGAARTAAGARLRHILHKIMFILVSDTKFNSKTLFSVL